MASALAPMLRRNLPLDQDFLDVAERKNNKSYEQETTQMPPGTQLYSLRVVTPSRVRRRDDVLPDLPPGSLAVIV